MTTDDGLKGEVSGVNVLRQLVKVIVNVERMKRRSGNTVWISSVSQRHRRKKNGK